MRAAEAKGRSWGAETFERLYAADPDPWGFASSAYERDKYAASLAALPRRRFACGLEVGCSIGVFTRKLAPRCGRLLAVDVADAAVGAARRRCRGLGVRVARRRLPAQWPKGSFDLIVISEVLYFLGSADIARAAARARASLRAGGVILLVNWTGVTDTPHTGETAARRFIAACGLRRRPMHGRPDFRLDVLTSAARGGHTGATRRE